MLNGVATLPTGDPEFTLGWGVIEWATRWLIQPDGLRAGEPWLPTDGQVQFLLWWYAVDKNGRWLYHHGALRRAKGSGKSPFAAVICLAELLGPVRLSHFDKDAPGGCVGKTVDMPLVQIAATTESQTANTMSMVRQMALKHSRVADHYVIDIGKTVFYTPTGGQLEIITSSAAAAEGARVTFAVEDETEHWRPSTGGADLASVLDRNLAKSNSRALETANAWEPGAESVAESTYEAWRAQEDGRTKGTSKILYDARIAPADTDLRKAKSLEAALAFVYEDCPWVDQKTIKERIWDLRTLPDVARRFYLNQPTAPEDAWVTPMEFKAIQATDRRIQDGEAVVMFFDGSKSNDATGLVGCAMSDGHIFTIGGWEPDPKNPESVVPVKEVDRAVENAFEKWNVIAFFADVREWESYAMDVWPSRYGDKLLVWAIPGGKKPEPVAWDMRTKDFIFTQATELCLGQIHDKSFTHDGNPMLVRHVENARRRNKRYGTVIGKESRGSRKKIDLAVCMIGARMLRRLAEDNPAWIRQNRPKSGNSGKVIVLS